VTVGVDVTVAGLAGVGLDLTWTPGLLGAGTLGIAVAGDPAALPADLVADVVLSPGARAPSAGLGVASAPADPGVVDTVLGLVGALTCRPAAGGGPLALALQVTGPGQTATVTLRSAGAVVATAVEPLD
jgi:hypothetical protein